MRRIRTIMYSRKNAIQELDKVTVAGDHPDGLYLEIENETADCGSAIVLSGPQVLDLVNALMTWYSQD